MSSLTTLQQTNRSRTARTRSSVLGQYELIAPLGRGGMAEVFLAARRGTANGALAMGARGCTKLVVVKRLRPDDASCAEYVTYPEDRYTQIEPGFTLGGPLMVARLWLFSGYLPSFRPLERTVTFRANQSTRTVTQDLTRQNGLVKVTARLSPRWRGKASFVTAREKQRNLLPAQDGTSDPNARRHAPGHPDRSHRDRG